jgi:ATP-binding cassette, subfamily B, bacterial
MRVMKFIWQMALPFRLPILVIFCSIGLYGLFGSLRPYCIKLLVNAISLDQHEVIWTIACYLIAIYVAIPVNWRIVDLIDLYYQPRIKNYIARHMFDYVTCHEYRFFQNNFAGSISSKITDLATSVPQMIQTMLYQYASNTIGITIAMFTMAQVSPYFAMIIIIWVIILLTASFVTVKKFNYLANNTAEAVSRIIGHTVDSISNILSVRLFSRRAREISELDRLQDGYLQAYKVRGKFMFWLYSAQGLGFFIHQLGSLLLLLYLYQQGEVTAGDFAMILMINNWIVDNLWALLNNIRTFSENWGMADQALKTLYIPINALDSHDAKPLILTKGQITFDRVSFRYLEDSTLFRNKSVVIAAGSKVGLVGYSGSGKSTFINLILRLYDIQSGQILIDNQDIRNVTQDSLRNAISMIPQDPLLFHRSLMENIRYGKTNASDEEVMIAAKRAYADEFIIKLEKGYDAMVGERGVKLSGGQRQRIAIARAILKNAPILILDEATSQLDSVTEDKIQDSLEHLMQNKTTIVIAHRLSTLLRMDRILVFDQGKIIEDGDHRDLIARGGRYKQLWDAQVGGFLPLFND